MNNYDSKEIYIMYLRKSRADEQSIEDVLQKHEDDLQLFAEKTIGYRIPEKHIFREIVSGETISSRPLMKEVLKIMETGNVKGVLCVDPQRLTRGDMLDQGHIVNAFKYTNTLIMTPFKNYDLNDSNDMKLLKMEFDHGADYLDYFKMIQARGKLSSVRSGNYIMPIAPYGYEIVSYSENGKKVRTLYPIEYQADIVRKIFTMYNSGISMVAIRNFLNEENIKPLSAEHWITNTIRAILCNPVYIGKICWGRNKPYKTLEHGELVKHRSKNENTLIFDGMHKAIISDDVFYSVQEKLEHNKPYADTSELKNSLAGLIFCGACGRIMRYTSSSSKKLAHGRLKENRLCCTNQRYCKTKSSLYEIILDSVIESMKKVIDDFDIIFPDVNTQESRDMIRALQDKLQYLKGKEETMYELLETRVYTVDVFTMRHAELEKERQAIKSDLERLINVTQTETHEQKKKRFSQALEALADNSVSAKDKNVLLKTCIEKIIYHVESNKRNANISLDIQYKL